MTVASPVVARRAATGRATRLTPRWFDALVLAVLTALLNGWRLARPVPWRDEAATWWSVDRPAGEIVAMTGHVDAVHRLYLLLAHQWVRLTELSVTDLRALSVVGVAAAAAGCYAVGGQLGGRVGGWASGLIMALMPWSTWAAVEARSYAWVMAVAAVTLALLIRALVTDEWRWWLAFTAAAVLLAWTFLLAVLVCGAVPVALAGRRRGWRRGLLALAGVAVATIPLAVTALAQQAQVAWLPNISGDLALAALWGNWWGPAPPPGLAGVGLLLGGLAALVLSRDPRRGPGWRLALLLAWWWIPTLVLLALTAAGHPSFWARYVVASVPALAVIVGLAVARLRTPWGAAAILLVAALAMPGLVASRQPSAKGEPWPAVAAQVAQERRPGDAVAFVGGGLGRRMVPIFPDALAGLPELTAGPAATADDSLYGGEATPTEIATRAASYRRVWLVGEGAILDSPEGQALIAVGFAPVPGSLVTADNLGAVLLSDR